MACIRRRRGRWVVDFRDNAGVRRWISRRTRQEAEQDLRKALERSRPAGRPRVDPAIRVADYARRWLTLIGPTVKRRTIESYTHALHRHLLPAFGRAKVSQLEAGWILEVLSQKLASGLSRNTVRI